ncbi:MAG TPA: hypothetical protein DEA67_02130 [Selenomonas sp.]|nr:hypothetical protein [Selenomonas sp.]
MKIFLHSRNILRGGLCLALLGGFVLTMPLPQAEARLGTGIGVTLPFPGTGSRATESAPVESYAALTQGEQIEELTVKERGGKLYLTLRVTNRSDAPFSIAHRTGQLYDFAVLDRNGATLWRWSDGMAFTQALTQTTIEPHKAVTYKATIERKDYRKFKDDAVLVTAWLADTPSRLSTRIPQATSSGNNGAIFGTIIIGNGTWYHDD